MNKKYRKTHFVTRVLGGLILAAPFFLFRVDVAIIATILAQVLQLAFANNTFGEKRFGEVMGKILAGPQAIAAYVVLAFFVVPVAVARRNPFAAKSILILSVSIFAVGLAYTYKAYNRYFHAEETVTLFCDLLNRGGYNEDFRDDLDDVIDKAKRAEPLFSERYPGMWLAIAASSGLAGGDPADIARDMGVPEAEQARLQVLTKASSHSPRQFLDYLAVETIPFPAKSSELVFELVLAKALLDSSKQGKDYDLSRKAAERLIGLEGRHANDPQGPTHNPHLPKLNFHANRPRPSAGWFRAANGWEVHATELYLNSVARSYAHALVALLRTEISEKAVASLIRLASPNLGDDLENVLYDTCRGIHESIVSSESYSPHARLRAANNLADLQVRYLNELAKQAPQGEHGEQMVARRAATVRDGESLLEESAKTLSDYTERFDTKTPYALTTLSQLYSALAHSSYYRARGAIHAGSESDFIAHSALLRVRLDAACRHMAAALLDGLEKREVLGSVHDMGFCWFAHREPEPVESGLIEAGAEPGAEPEEIDPVEARKDAVDKTVGRAAARWRLMFKHAQWTFECEHCRENQ